MSFFWASWVWAACCACASACFPAFFCARRPLAAPAAAPAAAPSPASRLPSSPIVAVVGDLADDGSLRRPAGRALDRAALRRFDGSSLRGGGRRVDPGLAAGPLVALVLVLPLLGRVLARAGVDVEAEGRRLGRRRSGRGGRRRGGGGLSRGCRVLGRRGRRDGQEDECDEHLVHDYPHGNTEMNAVYSSTLDSGSREPQVTRRKLRSGWAGSPSRRSFPANPAPARLGPFVRLRGPVIGRGGRQALHSRHVDGPPPDQRGPGGARAGPRQRGLRRLAPLPGLSAPRRRGDPRRAPERPHPGSDRHEGLRPPGGLRPHRGPDRADPGGSAAAFPGAVLPPGGGRGPGADRAAAGQLRARPAVGDPAERAGGHEGWGPSGGARERLAHRRRQRRSLSVPTRSSATRRPGSWITWPSSWAGIGTCASRFGATRSPRGRPPAPTRGSLSPAVSRGTRRASA